MASDEPLSEYEPEFYDTRALNMIGPTYDVKIQFYFAEVNYKSKKKRSILSFV